MSDKTRIEQYKEWHSKIRKDIKPCETQSIKNLDDSLKDWFKSHYWEDYNYYQTGGFQATTDGELYIPIYTPKGNWFNPDQNYNYIIRSATDNRKYRTYSRDGLSCNICVPSYFWNTFNNSRDLCVIVEDTCSALRIAEEGFIGISLQGVILPYHEISRIMSVLKYYALGKNGYTCLIALDPDLPGQTASESVYRTAKTLFKHTEIYTLDKEFKYMNNDEVNSVILDYVYE